MSAAMLTVPPSIIHKNRSAFSRRDEIRKETKQFLVQTIRGKTCAIELPLRFTQNKNKHGQGSSISWDYESFLIEIVRRSIQFDDSIPSHMKSKLLESKSNWVNMMYLKHGKKVIDRTNFQFWLQKPTSNDKYKPINLSVNLRLKGGMADRQNRVGSKFGGGGVSSTQNAERDRKERLRQLALESVDLAKDPYLMRNHLGTYECKLCLTLHTNEGNYLAHTQGKKHQAGLAKRAAMEAKLNPTSTLPQPNLSKATSIRQARVKIGRPGYQVTKSRHSETNQRCLSFQLTFPQLEDSDGIQPRHRFMSAYEQRVDSPPDRNYQYLLIACHPYETIGFKVPNETIDKGEGKFVTNWDAKQKTFTLTFYFVDSEPIIQS